MSLASEKTIGEERRYPPEGNGMKCPNCGAENPNGQNFCVDCGSVIPKLDRFSGYWGSGKEYAFSSEGRISDFLFTVGQNEKHTIAVRYNTKHGKFTVYVDSTDKTSHVKKVGPKSVSLDIGKEEKHNMILSISGFWTLRLEASADGVTVYKS